MQRRTTALGLRTRIDAILSQQPLTMQEVEDGDTADRVVYRVMACRAFAASGIPMEKMANPLMRDLLELHGPPVGGPTQLRRMAFAETTYRLESDSFIAPFVIREIDELRGIVMNPPHERLDRILRLLPRRI